MWLNPIISNKFQQYVRVNHTQLGVMIIGFATKSTTVLPGKSFGRITPVGLPGFTSKLSMFQTEVMLKDNEY
jgi:hypothetical protein